MVARPAARGCRRSRPRRASGPQATGCARGRPILAADERARAAALALSPEAQLRRHVRAGRRRARGERGGAAAQALSFVVQKHWASRLHYDFRLELDGVLLSWAVPKGPSFDPSKMQMAIHVEDHPLDYAGFEGTIPPRQYGAGTVIVWDRGTWQPEGDPRDGMAEGKLVFRLHGEKLAGLWELVRIAKPGDKQDAWMLFKKKDAWARPVAEYDVITALPDSVVAQAARAASRTREPREPRARAGARRRGACRSARREPPRADVGAAAARAAAGSASSRSWRRSRPRAPAGRLDRRDQVRRLSADGAHRAAARRG